MILAETLECTVPSANAVNIATITCVTEATNLPDVWMAIAGVVTALATIVLAVFARRAWVVSRQTLKKMEDQIIAASRQATDSRQIGYLVDYTVALKTMVSKCDRPTENLEDLKSRATDAWMVWAMDLFRADPDMRKVSEWWHTLLTESTDQYRVRRTEFNSPTAFFEGTQEHLNHQLAVAAFYSDREQFYDLVGKYIGNLQSWQVDESKKDWVFAELSQHMNLARENVSS